MKKLFENFRRFIHEGMMNPTAIEALPEEGRKLAARLSTPTGEPIENLKSVLDLNEMLEYPLPMNSFEILGDEGFGQDLYFAKLYFGTKEDMELWWSLLRKGGIKDNNSDDYHDYAMIMVERPSSARRAYAIYIRNPLPKEPV